LPFFIYTKIRYKCDDDFWNKVRAYKRERDLTTLNSAVTELLTMGLEEYKRQKVERKKLEVQIN